MMMFTLELMLALTLASSVRDTSESNEAGSEEIQGADRMLQESQTKEFKPLSSILPDYFLYDKQDKSFKMIVQHEYFKKNLEKVTVQEFANPFVSKTAKSDDFDKPMQPLGTSKEIEFQRAFRDSPDLKFARSDLF